MINVFLYVMKVHSYSTEALLTLYKTILYAYKYDAVYRRAYSKKSKTPLAYHYKSDK